MFVSVFWGRSAALAGFFLLFFVFGAFWHQRSELEFSENELLKHNGQQAVLIGIVDSEPEIGEKTIRIKLKVKELQFGEESFYVSGNVLITCWRYPEYRYGDKLLVFGKMEAPPVFETFNYRDYLKKDKIYSVVSFPEIKIAGSGYDNPVMEHLFAFKDGFRQISRQLVAMPQEGLLEALAFGDKNNISQEWKDKLNFTGTRHITAVSGMNITIIAFLIFSFALSFGLWRQQAFYLTIFLLTLYILMTGASPSSVRAGIMGGFFLTAQHFGRLSAASRTIVFASTFMLFLNPLLLRLDVGFQLSFLAMMGLIYLQPILLNFFKKIPNFKFFPLKTTLAATLSAQIFTFPILVYNFGYIPLISPITNILIVPLLAPITILIFIFGIAGIIFSPLGLILSWPSWIFLTYIVKIIEWFSKIPFASLILEISWIWLIISYLILGLVVWRLNQKQKLKFLQY